MKPPAETLLLTSALIIGVVLKAASCTECGHPSISQRVVGGERISSGKTPWMGSLLYNGNHVCGAAVISRTCLATAAHCLNGKDRTQLSVMLGTMNLTGPSSTRVFIAVKTVTLHPEYNDIVFSRDLAMLELKNPINFTSNILPICLPGPNQSFPDGMMCSLTGWGSIAEGVSLPEPFALQEVKLPLINADACDRMFLEKYGEMYPVGTIRSDNICAGYTNQRKDGCQGDSGGPLACQVGDTWFLVGIVSWGVGCATPGIPGVYTKVSNFTTWMVEQCNLNGTFKKMNATTVKTTTVKATTVKATTVKATTVKTTTANTTTANTTTVNTTAANTTTANTTTANTATVKPTTEKTTPCPSAKLSTQQPKLAAQVLGAVKQTTAANGANLGSSIPMSLLIISSIIVKIRDIL